MKRIIKEIEQAKKQLLDLVDKDSQAYLNVVKTKGASLKKKTKALKEAREVPRAVCRLCYKLVKVAPVLVKNGNQNLLSDVEAAVEMLLSSFNAALVFTREE